MTPDDIKTARQKAGLTQQESADMMRVHLRTWQKWEYGKREMSLGLLEMFLILSREPNVSNDHAADLERETE
ncbi:helix-turn-helix domain-containing protein [Acetobacter orientalis]|uniref:HTH cro/C1-type domain-containing protein n=1 Tax=Acetobacter orientalis TaxID=146474 RepID=A0A0D6NK45_9PROT|nr:helix-turn-helix domain-containing protein [Acetobacter orientalis]GAN65973.1 hypothetical protein Abor_014_138 [Acetobacter orientalis]GBR17507.1 hypothetical protein AA0481_1379 [Acetobacter orientalis NRIC 0481]GEL60353.1 hypothetical protein AOR02nite_01950 [Acetobacter orientalis]